MNISFETQAIQWHLPPLLIPIIKPPCALDPISTRNLTTSEFPNSYIHFTQNHPYFQHPLALSELSSTFSCSSPFWLQPLLYQPRPLHQSLQPGQSLVLCAWWKFGFWVNSNIYPVYLRYGETTDELSMLPTDASFCSSLPHPHTTPWVLALPLNWLCDLGQVVKLMCIKHLAQGLACCTHPINISFYWY